MDGAADDAMAEAFTLASAAIAARAKPGLAQEKLARRMKTTQSLRDTDATRLPNAGAERVDLQALLGHERISTTPMHAHVGPERMEQGVARL